jgi:hypothetical protein
VEPKLKPEARIELAGGDFFCLELLRKSKGRVFIELNLDSQVHSSERGSTALQGDLVTQSEFKGLQDKRIGYFWAEYKSRYNFPVSFLDEGSELVLAVDISRHGLVTVVEADLVVEPVGEEEVAFAEFHLGGHKLGVEGEAKVFAPLVGEHVGDREFVLNVKKGAPLEGFL